MLPIRITNLKHRIKHRPLVAEIHCHFVAILSQVWLRFFVRAVLRNGFGSSHEGPSLGRASATACGGPVPRHTCEWFSLSKGRFTRAASSIWRALPRENWSLLRPLRHSGIGNGAESFQETATFCLWQRKSRNHARCLIKQADSASVSRQKLSSGNDDGFDALPHVRLPPKVDGRKKKLCSYLCGSECWKTPDPLDPSRAIRWNYDPKECVFPTR